MADDPTRPPETPLTIALAEYAHLQEARRAVHAESNSRFTFFLGVASAATAVSAGLITTGGSASNARIVTVCALGCLVLLLGVAVFARQLEFNDRARRYAVATTAIRTYLTRQAPDLAPYVMMPTLDDPGPFAAEPYRRGWPRDLVSLAGTVGLLNSALLAVGSGMLASRATPVAAAVALALVVFVAAITTQVVLLRRRLARSAREVGEVISRRPPLAPLIERNDATPNATAIPPASDPVSARSGTPDAVTR